MWDKRDGDTDYASNNIEAASTASTSTFITAFVTNATTAGVQFIAWVILRRLIKAVYEPRTYIPAREKQATPMSKNFILPIWQIINADPKDILRKNGVDMYLFLRFIRMLAKALLPIWLVSWLVLMPIDSAGMPSGKDGLDQFTFGNIAKDQQQRYWAHIVMVYLFNGWWFYQIWKEMAHWLKIRQQYLISPSHSKLAQASTVLVTGIPPHLMEERALAKLFSHLPGGVQRIWLVRNLKNMPDVYERREEACDVLESAQVELIKKAHHRKNKMAREAKKYTKKGRRIPSHYSEAANPPNEDGSPLSLADELVPRKERPKYRLKPSWSPIRLGFLGIGKKVDAIEWAQKEIVDCTEILDNERALLAKDIDTPGLTAENFPPRASAFIHFNQQIAAHMAQQCLSYQEPFRMDYRFIEQSPENVIWRNMSLNSYEVNLRSAISYAITGGLIFGWAPLTAIVGGMANIAALTEKWKWLSWLNGDDTAHKLLQGVFTGVVPPVLLALLTMLFPIFLRHLSMFQGTVSHTEVELDVMTRYFIFLVIHAFLITTLSSGLVAALKPLSENPSQIASILATNLPTASTFFITRILLQFTGTIGNLLQPVTVILYYVRVILGGGTPRKIFHSRYQLQEPEFGTDFPNITVYACIMITYMIISPVINGFGACFCVLSYFVYKYLFIWVMDQPPSSDTGGLFFPKAITHVFVGFYIQEIALVTLFFLARDDKGKVSALPQAVLMIIMIVVTIAFHYLIKKMYNPLKVSLPLSLADLAYGMPRAAEELERAKSRGEIVPSGHSKQPSSGSEDAPWNSKALTFGEDVSASNSNSDTCSGNNPQEKKPSYSEKDPHPRLTGYAEQDPNPSTQYIELAELGGSPRKAVSQHTGTEGEEDAEDEVDPETQYFAVHGGPGVLIHNEDEADDPAAFFHPATKDPQRPIWIPLDELGLGAALNAANIEKGVRSSTRAATMTHKGKVQISGVPPE